MAKPNISPLTFRPSEQSLAFVQALKNKGLTTTEIIEAALFALSDEMSQDKYLGTAYTEVEYVKSKARHNPQEGRK